MAPSSTAARWTGASPTASRRRPSAYAHAAGETDAVAGLVDALALPLYYDGRHGDRRGLARLVRDDELGRYPALAVFGAWFRVADRAARRGRALARARRRRDVAIPLSDGSATIEPWVADLRAYMMPDGVEQALADAELALDELRRRAPGGPRAPRPRRRACAPRRDRRAPGRLHGGRSRWAAAGASEDVYLAHAQLALLASEDGAWGEAGRHARAAQAVVEEAGLGDYATSALALCRRRPASRSTRGGTEDARAALARAHRLRPLLDHGLPWLTVQVGLELTRAHLALGEAGAGPHGARRDRARARAPPGPGHAGRDARELREHVAATSGPAGAWAMSLTGAELRLLPYLATHLTFPEIASQAVHLAQHRQDARRSRSTASSASRRAARRSSARSRSGCWTARSIPPGRKSHPDG